MRNSRSISELSTNTCSQNIGSVPRELSLTASNSIDNAQAPSPIMMATFPRRVNSGPSAVVPFHLIGESDAANLLLNFSRSNAREVITFDTYNITPVNPRPTILGLKFPCAPVSEGHDNRRFRAVSACDSDLSTPCVTPPQAFMKIKHMDVLEDLKLPSIPKNLNESPLKIRSLKSVDSDEFDSKKHVGDVLPEGAPLKGILRKKFSWKSFPELEEYLIDHRLEYLDCSNSLNYTKAQKLYNNRLTQGLLDLAAESGYIFEGFTFAAVRDRIRCFYKSYVQASKKKKRLKGQKQRSRTVSM